MEATTTKITIMATTMEVTDAPFRQSMSSGRGRNCLTGHRAAAAMHATPVEQLSGS
jgi:hypothetical protein